MLNDTALAKLSSFETYLVGGAVRDHVMNKVPKDYDYVVIGATVQNMLDLGFEQVGKDFPVFMFKGDVTKQFALARRERKTGSGHTGFTTETDAVSLVEDLSRRDITMNAMAIRTTDGMLVDPFGGREAIVRREIQHINASFAEDPLRVLRVARFAARYNFSVNPSTMDLMTQLVHSGELNHLSAERIFGELMSGLETTHPEIMVEVLNSCGVIDRFFPNIHPNLPQVLSALKAAVQRNYGGRTRFTCLLHNATPKFAHDLCDNLKVDNRTRSIVKLFTTFFADLQRARSPKDYLDLFHKSGGLKLLDDFIVFTVVCALFDSSIKLETVERIFEDAYKFDSSQASAEALASGLQGPKIGEYIRAKQLDYLNNLWYSVLVKH